MNKILVTPRSVTSMGWHPSLDRLKDAGCEIVFPDAGTLPSEAKLCALIPGCTGYLAGVEKITAKVLHHAADLKVISRNGVGTDNIDTEVAKQLSIAVRNAPGSNARGVAELALGLILSISRWIPTTDQAIRIRKWDRQMGTELFGKTLGVVGCGRIGRELSLLALSIGMKVKAYEPYHNDFFTYSTDFSYVSLDNLLTTSDYISLHCPPLPDGQPLFGNTRLLQCKDGAALINTARGELIDELAVVEALNKGSLRGYAADAFQEEPPLLSPLINHARTICTAHIGGYTEESMQRAMDDAVTHLLEQL